MRHPGVDVDKAQHNQLGANGTMPLSELPGFRANEKFRFSRIYLPVLLDNKSACVARHP